MYDGSQKKGRRPTQVIHQKEASGHAQKARKASNCNYHHSYFVTGFLLGTAGICPPSVAMVCPLLQIILV